MHDLSDTISAVVELCLGTRFSPFDGDIFSGNQMRGQERGSGGPFFWPETPIFAI